MEEIKARPLKTIKFKSRPITGHCLAWSCDAELAVATDDVLYIFLPEHLRLGDLDEGAQDEELQHQFSMVLRATGLVRPDPTINAQLCAHVGVRIAVPRAGDENWYPGVGTGLVTGSGASVCQIMRVEWSPNGLGCNLRPVLTVLSTNGGLFVLGEHIDLQSTVISGMRTRSFKAWRMLWGLGAQLPLPDPTANGGYRIMNEKIQAFSWAKEILHGRALLAYMTDVGEIALMSVQLVSRSNPSASTTEGDSRWDIQEVSRFGGRGIHTKEDATDIIDPDFVPHGSPFSLKWSPWLIEDGKFTAILAYLAKDYVGFRKVTLQADWAKGELPKVQIDETDITSICTFLSSDAFIEWENTLGIEDGKVVCRGLISTPFDVKPFQVCFSDTPKETVSPHYTWECSSTYSRDDEISSMNPITGITLHPQDPSRQSRVPLYTMTRLSATAKNQDWYQTNLAESQSVLPQWADKIRKQTTQLVSRMVALDSFESDSDDSDDDDDEMLEQYESKLQVHPYRFRIWGLASSPGGGTTAALISRHSTQHPQRKGSSKLVFGWHQEGSSPVVHRRQDLTTEGQLWEWMYGGGPEVPGTTRFTRGSTKVRDSPLRKQFKPVIARQRCVFCDAQLEFHGNEARCSHGHEFARCAATGLAILEPEISRICAVCELRCLKVSEMARIAEEYLGSGTVVGASGEGTRDGDEDSEGRHDDPAKALSSALPSQEPLTSLFHILLARSKDPASASARILFFSIDTIIAGPLALRLRESSRASLPAAMPPARQVPMLDGKADFEGTVSSRPFLFVVGEERREFYLHREAIAALSPVLSALVNGKMREATEGRVEWPDIDVDTFVRFAEYVYTGDYKEPEVEIIELEAPETIDLTGQQDDEEEAESAAETSVTSGSQISGDEDVDEEESEDGVEDEGGETADEEVDEEVDEEDDDESDIVLNIASVSYGYTGTHAPVVLPKIPTIEFPKRLPYSIESYASAVKLAVEGEGPGEAIEYDPYSNKRRRTSPTAYHKLPLHVSSKFKAMRRFYRLGAPKPPTSRRKSWHPSRNTRANEKYEAIFSSHARLYIFADRYGVANLKEMTLWRLHMRLMRFQVFRERVPDLLALAEEVYKNTVEEDPARLLMCLFFNCFCEHLRGDPAFKSTLQATPDFAAGLVDEMSYRLAE